MISEQLIAEQHINECVEIHKKTGNRIVDIFLDKKVVDEDRLIEFFAKHYQLPIMDLSHISFSQDIISLIPGTIARQTQSDCVPSPPRAIF
jgi:hypothetical protein